MTEETTAPAAAAVPTAVRGEPAAPAAEDRVTIRMPAEGAYLSVLRTATAGLAARLSAPPSSPAESRNS